MSNDRYDIARFCHMDRYIVVDRTRGLVVALTETGEIADNTRPDHMHYFGMSQAEASEIARTLNQ